MRPTSCAVMSRAFWLTTRHRARRGPERSRRESPRPRVSSAGDSGARRAADDRRRAFWAAALLPATEDDALSSDAQGLEVDVRLIAAAVGLLAVVLLGSLGIGVSAQSDPHRPACGPET